MFHHFYITSGKRMGDLFLALLALVVLAPLMALTALAVRVFLGTPVVFSQPRAGKHGHVFTLYKFRSMRNATDALGAPLPDEQRITSMGKLLRALSLDELPQLWNVICGDMSLVGPRPLLVAYRDRYSAHQRRRLEVLPGITGYAQIKGRNALSWGEKFDLDVWYVDNMSLRLDLRILGATLTKVFSPRGISASGHATMPEFTGSELERIGNPTNHTAAQVSTCGIHSPVSR